MRKVVSAIVMFFAATTMLIAQDYSRIQDTDELDRTKKALTEVHPHIFGMAEIEDVVKINNSQSKVIYTKDGTYNEAIVNSARKDMLLIATFKEIDRKEVPQVVLDAFKKSDQGSWTMERAFLGSTPTSDTYYRLDVHKKGKEQEKMTLFYDEKGSERKAPYKVEK